MEANPEPRREHIGAIPARTGTVLDRVGDRGGTRTGSGERSETSWRGIVVGFDGSAAAARATSWAAREAASRSCPLHIVRVVASAAGVSSSTSGPAENERFFRTCAEELLVEAGVRRPGNDGLDLHTATVPDGSVGGRLAEYTRNVGADVVVVGGAVPGDGSRPVFGSVGADLAAATAVPVFVVRSTARNPASVPRGPRVMAVCDDGATSARVLHAAFDVAAHWGVEVAVVHVERRFRGVARGVAAHAFRRQLRGCAALYPQVSARVEAVVEHPAQAVLAVSQDAGLVVVGDRGRRLGHGLATGTVSHTALHRVRSSVALV